MNEREKRLALAFGVVLAGGVFLRYVYPQVVEPMFDYRARLAEAERDRDELQAEYDDLEKRLKARYQEYVLRTGSTIPTLVSNEIVQRIHTEFTDAKFTGNFRVNPREPDVDKRTRVSTLNIAVSAQGTFAQCIKFARGVYRLPYIVRFSSLKLSPISKAQNKAYDQVKLDGDIEVLILPEEKLLGKPDGEQPLYWDKRLALADSRRLEEWKPFTPYVETVVADPTPKPPPPPPPPPPPVDTGPPTSPYGAATVVRGVIGYGVDEVLLVNVATDEKQYVSVGGELDAGELVLVDAYGAVVHKVTPQQDYGYFVYPLGTPLADAVKLEDAEAWPEIQVAMSRYFERRRAERAAAEDFVGPEAPLIDVARAAPPGAMESPGPLPDGFVGPPFDGSPVEQPAEGAVLQPDPGRASTASTSDAENPDAAGALPDSPHPEAPEDIQSPGAAPATESTPTTGARPRQRQPSRAIRGRNTATPRRPGGPKGSENHDP